MDFDFVADIESSFSTDGEAIFCGVVEGEEEREVDFTEDLDDVEGEVKFPADTVAPKVDPEVTIFEVVGDTNVESNIAFLDDSGDCKVDSAIDFFDEVVGDRYVIFLEFDFLDDVGDCNVESTVDFLDDVGDSNLESNGDFLEDVGDGIVEPIVDLFETVVDSNVEPDSEMIEDATDCDDESDIDFFESKGDRGSKIGLDFAVKGGDLGAEIGVILPAGSDGTEADVGSENGGGGGGGGDHFILVDSGSLGDGSIFPGVVGRRLTGGVECAGRDTDFWGDRDPVPIHDVHSSGDRVCDDDVKDFRVGVGDF